jgi:hypothetical protein
MARSPRRGSLFVAEVIIEARAVADFLDGTPSSMKRLTMVSRSGRWAAAPIDEASAATMTPDAAPEFIHAAERHVFGGSYHGHAGKRANGRRHWGL